MCDSIASVNACLDVCQCFAATSLRWPRKICWLCCDGQWLVLTLTFVLWTRRVEDGYLPLKPGPSMNIATTYVNLVCYIMHERSCSSDGSSVCLTFELLPWCWRKGTLLWQRGRLQMVWSFSREDQNFIYKKRLGFLFANLESSVFFLPCARMVMLIVASMGACMNAWDTWRLWMLDQIFRGAQMIMSPMSYLVQLYHACMHACMHASVNIPIDVKCGACRFCDVERWRLHRTSRRPYYTCMHAW